MAEVISIEGTTATAKIRNPFIAFLLVLVTLGIYYLVWYYKINRELRDVGIGTSPLPSLLAISIGGLIIVPPFVSIWNTFGRIGEAEERAYGAQRISRGLGMVL